VPGIFTANSSGQGPAAVLNQDGSYNTVANPAPTGSVIVFYAVGAGPMRPAQNDGAVQPTTLPLPVPTGEVKVQIRGIDAKVIYAGAARLHRGAPAGQRADTGLGGCRKFGAAQPVDRRTGQPAQHHDRGSVRPRVPPAILLPEVRIPEHPTGHKIAGSTQGFGPKVITFGNGCI